MTERKKITVKFDDGDVAKFCLFKDQQGFARVQVYDGTKGSPDLLIQAQLTTTDITNLITALQGVAAEM